MLDWIQCETTSDTVEIHRGRNGYNYKGNKGKTLVFTLPVLVKNNADEILTKIYNCEFWNKTGKGRETSINSPQLMEFIWQTIMPFIDFNNMREVPKGSSTQIAMNRTQIKGTYIIEGKDKDEVISSNECYTFYQSVEFVVNYFLSLNENYFKDKVVYCNCDDTKSAFWIYFYNNFYTLGLKELIATHYDGTGLSYGNDKNSNWMQTKLWEKYDGYILKYNGKRITRQPAMGVSSNFHGDFRERICMDIAKNESDIIITNPPWGQLWRQFVECMLSTNKKLIFWGNNSAPTYNWFMPLLNEKKIHIIDNISDKAETLYFMTPNYYKKKVGNYIYTTEDLSFQKPNKDCYLTKKEMLAKGIAWYDDNNILCCDNAKIPIDTNEVLAVSTYIIKYGILNDGYVISNYHSYNPHINKKRKFARILIQKQ